MLFDSSMLLFARTMASDLNLQYREEKLETGWGPGIWFAIVAVIILAVLAAAFFVYKRSQKTGNEPRGLLMELCRAHRLNRGSRMLLNRLALAAELKQPAVMLVSPELFEATVDRVQSKTPLSIKENKCLAILRRRLFAIG